MESENLTILRDRTIPTAPFRKAAHALAKELVSNIKKRLMGKEDSVVLVCILRSSMVFLPSALDAFPSAPVAVFGIKRDEETAIAQWYYENLPPLTLKSTTIILDPMLATGGTAYEAVNRLIKEGVKAENIYFVGFIAAPEGVEKLTSLIPRENIELASVDERLDAKKFIVPGLGDFGDRYFGYKP